MYRPGQLGNSTKNHWNLAIILETGWGEQRSTSGSRVGARGLWPALRIADLCWRPNSSPTESLSQPQTRPARADSPHSLPGEEGNISTGACQIPAKVSKGTRELETPSPLTGARGEPFSSGEISSKILPIGPYLGKTLGLPH